MVRTPALIITAEDVQRANARRSAKQRPQRSRRNAHVVVVETKFTAFELAVGVECISRKAQALIEKTASTVNKEDPEEWIVYLNAARRIGGDNKTRFYELRSDPTDILVYNVTAQTLHSSSRDEMKAWRA